jgi:hypothetical protein
MGKYLLEVGTLEWRLLATPPSLVAAAAIWLSRLILGNDKWVRDACSLTLIIYPRVHHIHPMNIMTNVDFLQLNHHAIPQANFVFVDYVLILYDYQMAFSPIYSVVYALELVRLISRCYAVPQCSTHPNRCLLVPGLPIPFGFPFALACPALACITLFYWSSLCSCRATVRIPSSYIRIPSSSCNRASFLTDNASGISCHVRRFIRHAVDNSRVIAGYSLNFL